MACAACTSLQSNEQAKLGSVAGMLFYEQLVLVNGDHKRSILTMKTSRPLHASLRVHEFGVALFSSG